MYRDKLDDGYKVNPMGEKVGTFFFFMGFFFLPPDSISNKIWRGAPERRNWGSSRQRYRIPIKAVVWLGRHWANFLG